MLPNFEFLICILAYRSYFDTPAIFFLILQSFYPIAYYYLYRNWADGQPDNYPGQGPEGEDCVEFWTGDDNKGTWNDESCSPRQHYICERSINAGIYKINLDLSNNQRKEVPFLTSIDPLNMALSVDYM